MSHLKFLIGRCQEDPELAKEESTRREGLWTLGQIQIVDQHLKHVLTKFRLRGLNSYSRELALSLEITQVNQHLGQLLQIPLAYMDRELENNGNDDKRKQELKYLLHKL